MDVKLPTTICRDCVFAKFENNIQVDCTFHDRLWNLEKNGAILNSKTEDGKTYYELENRFCTAGRNYEWGEGVPKREWKSHVESRIAIQMDYVILTDKDTTFEDVLKSFGEAENQTPKPSSIIIVLNPEDCSDKFDSTDIVDEIRFKKVPWRIEHTDLKSATKYVKGRHFTIFHAGHSIPKNFSEKINEALNYNMTRFIGLRPDKNGDQLVLQVGVNLEDIVQKEGIEDYIKSWSEL